MLPLDSWDLPFHSFQSHYCLFSLSTSSVTLFLRVFYFALFFLSLSQLIIFIASFITGFLLFLLHNCCSFQPSLSRHPLFEYFSIDLVFYFFISSSLFSASSTFFFFSSFSTLFSSFIFFLPLPPPCQNSAHFPHLFKPSSSHTPLCPSFARAPNMIGAFTVPRGTPTLECQGPWHGVNTPPFSSH